MQHQEPQTLRFQGENGRDEFRREQVAGRVIELLQSPINVSPMVIDGDWGTGKSEFCHKLMRKFEEEQPDYRLLYVDAFKADHADNPLLTVLSSVLGLISDGEQKKKLRDKALPVVRFALGVGAKALFAHVLKQNTDELTEDLERHLQDAADDAIDASVQALLKDHEEAEQSLRTLQAALQEVAQIAPIVIFIDELDRCRPDYAVQMLEVIKHTFNVAGLQFVLVTNTKQLKAAINHRYGSQVNAQRYLDKFLKFSFSLPDFVLGHSWYREGAPLAAVEHGLTLLTQSAVLKDSTDIVKRDTPANQFFKSLIQQNGRSLREVETFVRYLEIYQQLSQGLEVNTRAGYQLLRIFGVFVFCFRPEVAESISKNKANADVLAGLLGVSELPDIQASSFRRSHAVDIAIMLAQSSALNHSKYVPGEGRETEQEYWEDNGMRYFQSTFDEIPRHRHDPVKDAIRCLQLGQD